MQLTAALLLLGTASLAAGAAPYFRISVVDSQTGRGVPLVLLRTGDFVQQYSDSAGNIAFYEPGLMDQPVWFSVLADGYNLSSSVASNPTVEIYESPYDSGLVLVTTTGGSATVVVDRVQPAERVYRLTGGGLYRDSVLTGDTGAIPPSVLERAVMGVPRIVPVNRSDSDSGEHRIDDQWVNQAPKYIQKTKSETVIV